ncbi:UNVERIFIED_CONTAM: hypothetical protein K2H54_069450 [Gekko kuhli]
MNSLENFYGRHLESIRRNTAIITLKLTANFKKKKNCPVLVSTSFDICFSCVRGFLAVPKINSKRPTSIFNKAKTAALHQLEMSYIKNFLNVVYILYLKERFGK